MPGSGLSPDKAPSGVTRAPTVKLMDYKSEIQIINQAYRQPLI